MALQRMSPGHLQASGCSVHDTSGDSPVRVHIGVLPATMGISRFLELHQQWQYNKVGGQGCLVDSFLGCRTCCAQHLHPI